MMLLGTLLPTSSLPQVSTFYFIKADTLVHFLMFTVLTFLLIVGFRKQYSYHRLHHFAIRYALLVATGYGILIEVLQHTLTTTRHAEPLDLLANTAGCVFGLLIFKWIHG